MGPLSLRALCLRFWRREEQALDTEGHRRVWRSAPGGGLKWASWTMSGSQCQFGVDRGGQIVPTCYGGHGRVKWSCLDGLVKVGGAEHHRWPRVRRWWRMRSCGWQAWEVVKESRESEMADRADLPHQDQVARMNAVQTFVSLSVCLLRSLCLSSTHSLCPYCRQLDLCLGHLRLQKSVLVVTNNFLYEGSHLIRRNVSCRHG